MNEQAVEDAVDWLKRRLEILRGNRDDQRSQWDLEINRIEVLLAMIEELREQ